MVTTHAPLCQSSLALVSNTQLYNLVPFSRLQVKLKSLFNKNAVEFFLICKHYLGVTHTSNLNTACVNMTLSCRPTDPVP